MNACVADAPYAVNTVSLSVLVAVYQSAAFLRRLVESLAAQDVPDAEFIFCDDGSTDGSADALEELLDEFGMKARSKVLHHAERLGVARARQDLLMAARGEYFIFADADDFMETGMYSGLLAVARWRNADLAWEGWTEVKCDGTKEIHAEALEAEPSAAALRRAVLRDDMHGSLCNKLIRRSFVLKAGASFHDDITCCEDVDFLMAVLAANPTVAYSGGCHYHYVRRRDSITKSDSMPHLASIRKVVARLENLFTAPEDLSAVQMFKMRFRYYASMDFSVPDDAFASYFPEVRSLSDGFSAKRRVVFWFSAHGMRPLVRFVWYLLHPVERQ